MATDMNGFPQRGTFGQIVIDPGTFAFYMQSDNAVFKPVTARGLRSFEFQFTRTATNQLASGIESFVFGARNIASNTGATAIGTVNTASGTNSTCIGINNTSSAANSTTLGTGNTASGNGACAFGTSNTASGANSTAFGTFAHTFGVNGRHARSSSDFATSGDSQYSRFLIRKATADATPAVMTVDAGTATAINSCVLQNNNTFSFMGQITVRQSQADGTIASCWRFEGMITRGANAAATTLVTSTVTAISNATAITLPAFSADTTLGGLALTVTGVAATNFRWHAYIDTCEVIYA